EFLHEEQPYFVEEEEPVVHSLDVTLDSALPRNAQKCLWQMFSKVSVLVFTICQVPAEITFEKK
ncbi:MAG: hypothetical protein ACK55Z_33455, partial [bacterium]